MNVKISYTIDLEDVPGKSAELLGISSKELIVSRRQLEEIISGIHNDKRMSTILEEIEALRKLLLKVDNTLADSQNLLSGYMQTKAQQSVPPQVGYPEHGGVDAPYSEE